MGRRAHITVSVKDDSIERKLRLFKKKIDRDSIIKNAKARVYFETPTAIRRRKKLRAIKLESLRRASQGGISYKVSR